MNRIRIHFFQMWIRGSGSGSTITERWIRGSGSTFLKCGSEDPDSDPRQNKMDPKRCYKYLVHYLGFSSLLATCQLHCLALIVRLSSQSCSSARVGTRFQRVRRAPLLGSQDSTTASLLGSQLFSFAG